MKDAMLLITPDKSFCGGKIKKMLTLLIVLCLPVQSTVNLNGIMYSC